MDTQKSRINNVSDFYFIKDILGDTDFFSNWKNVTMKNTMTNSTVW